LPVGDVVKNTMKISDCEMPRIDKPSICSAFWNAYLAGYFPYRRKGSSDKANKITLFTSSRPSSLGDGEASSEFRLKIASL
jgi:hypothetical protein